MMTAPGPHRCNGLFGNKDGGLSTGDGSRRDDDVGPCNRSRDHLLFLFLLFRCELAGIAALAFGIDLKFEELGAEAPDLFAGGAPDIVGLDNGAEPLCRGNRHETGNTGTEDEHRCRSYGTRGSCQHREELRAVVGTQDGCNVPAGRCLGTERIHALGAGDPRDKLEGEGSDLPVAHPGDRLEVVCRVHEPDDNRAFGKLIDIGNGRGLDTQHDSGTVQQICRA